MTSYKLVDFKTLGDERVPLGKGTSVHADWTEVQFPKSYKDLITFVEDRAGHDRRYAIDATKLVKAVSQSEKFPRKLENELGWKADENFDSGIKE